MKYETGERLYVSHFGEVFAGRYKPLDRPVMVTRLSDTLSSPKNRMRVVRETNLFRQMNCPFISPLFDVIQSETGAVFLHEYGEFRPLSSLSQPGTSEQLLQRIFIQLLLVVELINSKQLCIFPSFQFESLFIDPHGIVRVTDFSVIPGKDELDRTETPFTPPEVLRTSATITKASDVWVLGVILYFLATHEYPFEGDCLRGQMRPPMGASPALADLLQRMLQKKEQARITIDSIKTHAWLEPVAKEMDMIAMRIRQDQARNLAIDKGIMAEMARLGFSDVDVRTITGNESSDSAVAYKMLLREQTMKQFVEHLEVIRRGNDEVVESHGEEKSAAKRPAKPALKVFFPRGAARRATVGTHL